MDYLNLIKTLVTILYRGVVKHVRFGDRLNMSMFCFLYKAINFNLSLPHLVFSYENKGNSTYHGIVLNIG
jgi:hypothetical protein